MTDISSERPSRVRRFDQENQSSSPLLDVRRLKMHFPLSSRSLRRRPRSVVKAVDDVTFAIQKGETLGLVGESGSGKTTVSRCILRLYEPTGGRIIFEGRDLIEMEPVELRAIRREMQIVFQDPYSSLNPRMSAYEIIAEPLIVHKMVKDHASMREHVSELLVSVGLEPNLADRYPHEFSGGQRQRIAIARAIAISPKLIVCDEPVSSLDVSIQAQVINLLMDLQKQLSLTYLFVAHDLSVVRHIADRVAVMYRGRIVELAECDELFANPLHPYTQALISAVPIPDPVKERERAPVIRGQHAEAGEQIPDLREIRPSHWVACIKA